MLFARIGCNLERKCVVIAGERHPQRVMAADFLFISGNQIADVCAAQRVKTERVTEPRDVFGVVHVPVHVEIGILRRTAEHLRRFAFQRGHARGQGDRRGQVAVIRKAEIDLLRADDAALFRIQHHP